MAIDKLLWAKLLVWFWRFRTLQYAESFFKQHPQFKVVKLDFFGYRLALDVSMSNAQRLLYFMKERFIEERALLKTLMKPGMNVVDVGANIGYYMVMFQRYINQQGTIYCFEPEPDNLAELERNRQLNDFQNVVIERKALGAENKQTYLTPGINGNVSESPENALEIEMVSLDTVIQEPVHFLKVDVEGYEGLVLKGCEKVISTHKPILYVEIHPHFLHPEYPFPRILEFLQSYYQDLAYYTRKRENLGVKITSRYFGIPTIAKVEAPQELIDRCIRSEMKETFWMVCR